MRFAVTAVLLVMGLVNVNASGMDEVNEWRRRCGLRPFIEDPQMTQFAKMKARYRAERGLQNGHQGPKPPAGWHEGTGEATADWGWLTCEMESDYQYAGAAVCVGRDGTRYMVLVCRGGSGRPLLSRNNSPVHRTAHLTPNPSRAFVPDPQSSIVESAPPSTERSVSKPPVAPAQQAGTFVRSAPAACPNCGRVH